MGRRVELFRCLQGLLSVYKPSGQETAQFKSRLAKKVANEFNKLPWEPVRIRTAVLARNDDKLPAIATETDFVDNPLVIGQRFLHSDVVLNFIDPLPDYASGIQLIGIGEVGAYAYSDAIHKSVYPKSYHLTGMFGQASSNGLSTGSIIYRSPWRHITRPKMDRIIASIQFKARSVSLLQAGLIPNSQKAFEALSNPDRLTKPLKPMIEPLESLPPDHVTAYWDRKPEPTQPHSLRARPDPSSVQQLPPALLCIRCIKFEPPFFILEIQVAYETAEFLTDLMVNIGGALKSSAVLCQARRIRHGPFSVENSLLLKQCAVPQSLYDRLNQIKSEPPERDFESDDEYREFILSQLVENVDRRMDLFGNLAKCTLDKRIKELVKAAKEEERGK
nr:trna pseudouridine synthase 2 [Hymenolepis microstoma]